MKVNDLFLLVDTEDFFGITTQEYGELNETLIDQLASRASPDFDELEIALALTKLLEEEFIIKGTSGKQRLNNDNVRKVVRTCKLVLSRNNLPSFDLPFRDFDGFYSYWFKEGMSGSWAARRECIKDIFLPIIEDIEARIDEKFYKNFLSPISEPIKIENWQHLNDEISQLRNRLATAKTHQDYNAVGTACVRIIEGLSRVAYIQEIHGEQDDTSEPPIDKTNIRLGRVIKVGLDGRENAELRGLAKSTSEAAHKIKHANTPTSLQAGIACDATVLLVSIIHRIEEYRAEKK